VDIKRIIKKKVLGIFNSALELVTVDQVLNFCSFQDRDTAYERIFALWKISSPHAKLKWIQEEDPDIAESPKKAPLKSKTIDALPEKEDSFFKNAGLNPIQADPTHNRSKRRTFTEQDKQSNKSERVGDGSFRNLKQDTLSEDGVQIFQKFTPERPFEGVNVKRAMSMHVSDANLHSLDYRFYTNAEEDLKISKSFSNRVSNEDKEPTDAELMSLLEKEAPLDKV